MSVVKISRGHNRSISTTAVSVVLGLFVVLFLVRFGQEVLLEHELNDKVAVQRQANAELKDVNARLKAGLQYYQSTKYIEQRAREDLNLRGQNEEVLIPTGLDSTAEAPGSTSGINVPKPQNTAPPASLEKPTNAEKWFQLFQAPTLVQTSP